MQEKYEVVILGGGPAGLAAGIYSARSGLSTLMVEKGFPGGQIVNSSLVENYPGMHEGVSGMDLGQRMHTHAEQAGAETELAEVTGLVRGAVGEPHRVVTSEGDVLGTTVIIATGTQWGMLNVPGEAELAGRGVSYCATCDGLFYKGKKVVVVGGGDTAITDALELAKFASEVTVIHRRDELRATQVLQDKAMKDPRIKFIWSSVVDGIEGNPSVSAVNVRNRKNDTVSRMAIDGVFIAVGSFPMTGFLKDVVALDEAGSVIIDEQMATEVAGIFAAGDVRHGSVRQVIAAAGDGAAAALSARRYINSL